jgi:elongation factor P
MVIASKLKSGIILRIEGEIYKVLEVESKAGAAKLGGVVKAKLTNMRTGSTWERHFRPQERLEDVELEQRNMEFLFSDADNCTFMNPENFEQIQITRAMVGPAEGFLQAGMLLPVQFFEGRPIGALLPNVAEARVATTASPSHGRQDSAWKEATLDNGVRIQVPLFIAPGEVVRVDVKAGRYVERAHGENKRTA